MAENYRFFDSTLDDERKYNSDDFAEYFNTLISTGIVNEITTQQLNLTANGTAMETVLQTGKAYIEGRYYENTSDLILTHSTSDPTYDRIDRIVVRLDLTTANRFIKAFVLEGTPATSPTAPTLTQNADIHEIAIAQVRIIAGKSFIEATQITDERTYAKYYDSDKLDGNDSSYFATATGLSNHENDTTNPHNVSPAQIGAEKAVHKGTTAPADTTKLWIDTNTTPNVWKQYNGTAWVKVTPTTAGEVGAIPTAEKGTASGVATLDTTGNVPSGQLNNVAVDMQIIDDVVLVGDVSSINFSSIPTNYRHLQLVIQAKSSLTNNTMVDLCVRFNGVTTQNQSQMRDGVSITSSNGSGHSNYGYWGHGYCIIGRLPTSTHTDYRYWGYGNFYINDYNKNKFPSIYGTAGFTTHNGTYIYDYSDNIYAVSHNSGAINSISVFTNEGNLVAGSVVTLIGIK